MTAHKTNIDCSKTSSMKISFRRGIECYFDVDDVTIRVWGSVWSGREVVELNDQVVSSKISLRLSTPHEFEHAGHRYKVMFKIAKPMSGLVEIELYRNGEQIDSDQGRHATVPIDPLTGKVNWRKQAVHIALFALAGGVFGFTAAMLVEWLS